MPSTSPSAKEIVLISALIFLCFHTISWSQKTLWSNLLEDPQSSPPSRLTNNQKAYLAYLADQKEEAVTARNDNLTESVEQQYNLGTAYAQRSVSSGEVIDFTGLQQAELLLSGAASLETTAQKEIIHNLETVRRLLQKAQEQKQNQHMQQQSGSGDKQQQEQQEQQGNQENTSSQQEKETVLSENMKQQLAQYQKQLEGEQMQNQQFFDKQPPGGPQSDPFDMLNQVFGGQPQFDDNNTQGQKDW